VKKLLLTAAAIAALAAPALPVVITSPAFAQVAGEWTQCVAWNNGETWNIVNGQWYNWQCFELARKCTDNPNVEVTYYGSPVIVNAPYRRCTLS
jgi:hypothetical protein